MWRFRPKGSIWGRATGLLLTAAILATACAPSAPAAPTQGAKPAAATTAPAPKAAASDAKPAEIWPGGPFENELIIVATGGAAEAGLKEHFYEPFSKLTGVTVRAVAATNAEQWSKMKAMTEAKKVEWDILSVTDADGNTNKDALLPLDCNAIPNVKTVAMEGACKENRLLRSWGGMGIAYNTEKFPTGQHPKNWAEWWDIQKFPGPRSLPNHGVPWEVLAVALMADGVTPDKLFPMDVDRGFKKLDEIKPHIKVWWKTGDQSQQLMRDGEVVLSMMWMSRSLPLKNNGVPVDAEYNQSVMVPAYWGVAKDAPHPKAAMAFMNYFLERPEAHVAFGRQLMTDTSNKDALNLLPEAERRDKSGAHLDKIVEVDSHPWVHENRAKIMERWTAWLAE